MIHPAPETRRVVKSSVVVEVDLCGLQPEQEDALNEVMVQAAYHAICGLLIGQGHVFRKQQTWDVNASVSKTEERG